MNESFEQTDGNNYDSLHAATVGETKCLGGINNSNYDHLVGNQNNQGEKPNPIVEDDYAVVNKTTTGGEAENSTMQNLIYESSSGNYDLLHSPQHQQGLPSNASQNEYDSLNHNQPTQMPQHHEKVTPNTIYDALDHPNFTAHRQQSHDGYDDLNAYKNGGEENNVMPNQLYGCVDPDLAGTIQSECNNMNMAAYDNIDHVTATPPVVVEDEYAVVDKSRMSIKPKPYGDAYDNLQHNIAKRPNVEDEYAVVDKSRIKDSVKNNNDDKKTIIENGNYSNVNFDDTYASVNNDGSTATAPAVEDEYAVVDKSRFGYNSSEMPKPLPQAPRMSMSDILSKLDESEYNSLHETMVNSQPNYDHLTLGRDKRTGSYNKLQENGDENGAVKEKAKASKKSAKQDKKEKKAKKSKSKK